MVAGGGGAGGGRWRLGRRATSALAVRGCGSDGGRRWCRRRA